MDSPFTLQEISALKKTLHFSLRLLLSFHSAFNRLDTATLSITFDVIGVVSLLQSIVEDRHNVLSSKVYNLSPVAETWDSS